MLRELAKAKPGQVELLRKLWMFDHEAFPVEGSGGLEKAGREAPQDDRCLVQAGR